MCITPRLGYEFPALMSIPSIPRPVFDYFNRY